MICSPAFAVVAPSTFSSTLQVQGEDPNVAFDDWVGIPVAFADAVDNPGSLDISEIQVANNDDLIFIRATLHNTTPHLLSNLFLAFDADQNLTTGFDIFSLGFVGSEVGYQFDFPFQQATGVFNTGVQGVTDFGGDFIGLGLTFPFFDGAPPADVQVEWSIPIDLAIGPAAPGTPVFTSSSFDFLVYTDVGLGDATEKISYTLASAPVIDGDFNGDNVRDGFDFLEWQLGNSPNNGSSGDLALWLSNYGVPPLSAVSAVPEPGCACLALCALAIAWGRRTNRA